MPNQFILKQCTKDLEMLKLETEKQGSDLQSNILDLMKNDKIVQQQFGENYNNNKKDNDDDNNVKSFLEYSIYYNFPNKFNYNIFDNLLAFTLHFDEENVIPNSIDYIFLENKKAIHLKFKTLSTSAIIDKNFYYAFYISFNDHALKTKINSIDFHTRNNNRILIIKLTMDQIENIKEFTLGLNKNDIRKYQIFNNNDDYNNELNKSNFVRNQKNQEKLSNTAISVNYLQQINKVEIELKLASDEHQKENKSTLSSSSSTVSNHNGKHNSNVDDNKTKTTSSDKHNHHHHHHHEKSSQSTLNRKHHSKRSRVCRSLSESSCDDIKFHMNLNDSKSSSSSSSSKNAPLNTEEDLKKNSKHDNHKQKQNTSIEKRNRSVSESSSQNHDQLKGILKHTSRYGRTCSESSSALVMNDTTFHLCFLYGDESNNTNYSTESCNKFSEETTTSNEALTHDGFENCKKTVRFNDIIKKQLFRLDSSILGQRKKNQKRRCLKQRAMQRRNSESDLHSQ